jgi:malonyl CoA-acyl carrier protein transacylase
MAAYVFPGQGCQERGMGGALFDTVDEFRSQEHAIDDVLGYSVRRQCLEDPGELLSQTQYTQPCLFIVNALHYFDRRARGMQAEYFAGHSLGEYNALLAAGVLDLLTGLRLVQKRGELMARARNGGMAAVIGIAAETASRVLVDHGLSRIDMANYNAPMQTIISGPVDDVEAAAPLFEKAGARAVMKLRVSAAFHSRYMADAAREFGNFLEGFEFSTATVPVISNVTALPYPQNGSQVVSLLTRQIMRPVLWHQTVQYLLERNVIDIIEIGPGSVLTRLLQQIKDAK